METKKIVLVGDSGVGKTTLIKSYIKNISPRIGGYGNWDEVVGTLYKPGETLALWGLEEGQQPHITLAYDTPGGEDWLKMRVDVVYPNVSPDVFLVCFSVDSETSYENARKVYVPEIKQHCPEIPFLLVGTKMDLFNQPVNSGEWRVNSSEVRYQIAPKLGADQYMECSAYGTIELGNVIMQAMNTAGSSKWERRRNKSCHRNVFF